MTWHKVHRKTSSNWSAPKSQFSSSTFGSKHPEVQKSPFAPRPFAPVEQKVTPGDIAANEFQQNKLEATRLQIQLLRNAIAPEEQERLNLLQAKMDNYWVQRKEIAQSRPGFDLANISITPPQALQAKLTVGAAGDKYEQEADAMASRVMSMPDAAVQREVAPEQADAIASQVMLMPDSVVKIQVNSELNAPNENLPIHQMKTRFYVRADELTQSENIHLMHPVNLEQQLGGERVGHKGVRNLSNEDLIKLGGPNGDDPIKGYREYKDSDDKRLPASDIYIRGGHHRIHEIAERVKNDEIHKDTIIEFIIEMPNKEKLKTKPLGNTTIQREAIKEKEETPLLSIDASIQRDVSSEDEVQTSPSLQRAGDNSFQAGGNIESQLNSSKGGGSPLVRVPHNTS